ncbi:MAG: hypothetical protein ACQEQU_08825 [Spirochaetota bacterium]
MKSSRRPLKPIKKSINPAGVLLIVSVLISCMVVTGCAQADEMGEPQELTVEVLHPAGMRTVGSRAGTVPNEVLMTAEFYCKSSAGQLIRLKDERGDYIELTLSYDEARSCWRGVTAVSPCEEIFILAEDRNGEEGPSYCYGMTRLAFDGSQSAIVEGRPVYSLSQEGPAGGYIYYEQAGIDYLASGWRYLESAPYGWDDGVVPTAPWGSYGELAGAILDGIGQGIFLTELLCELDEAGTAAEICNEAVINGRSDWFLPSGGELEALFNQLREKSAGTPLEGLPNHSSYWSSQEISADKAKVVRFVTHDEPEVVPLGKSTQTIACLPSRQF